MDGSKPLNSLLICSPYGSCCRCLPSPTARSSLYRALQRSNSPTSSTGDCHHFIIHWKRSTSFQFFSSLPPAILGTAFKTHLLRCSAQRVRTDTLCMTAPRRRCERDADVHISAKNTAPLTGEQIADF